MKKRLIIVGLVLALALCGVLGIVSVSAGASEDITPPTITVDFGEYDSTNLPKGQVGVKYTVFPATALDVVDGEKIVDINVSIKNSNRNIYDEGSNSFTPTEKGIYILTYKATDVSGNTASNKYSIEVLSEVEVPEIILSAEESYSVFTGTVFRAPDATFIGGSGNVKTSVVVSYDGKEEYTSSKLYGNVFVPVHSGEYTFTFRVSDYLGREDVKTFKLNVTDSSKPILGDIVLPEVVIEGTTLDLSSLTATDYSTGTAKEATKTITVTYNGKTTTVKDSFDVEKLGETGDSLPLVVYFKAQGANGFEEVTFNLTAVNVTDGKKVYLPAYFAKPSNVTVGDVDFTLENIENENELSFIKPVLFQNFTLGFIPKNVSKLEVELTDSLILTEKVNLSISYGEKGTSFEINGQKLDAKTSIGNDVENYLRIADGVLQFNVNGGSTLIDLSKISTFANGNPFNGFTTNKVTFKIKVSTLDKASLTFTEINNVNISKGYSIVDAIAPEVYLDSVEKGRVELGDMIYIPYGIACDVLGEVVDFSVTVKDPDGKVILGPESAANPHFIKAEKYGNYIINYTIKDSADNSKRNLQYGVTCVDRVKPVISVSGSPASTVEVGKTISLPDFKVTDNISSFEEDDLIAYLIVVSPNFHHDVVVKNDNGKYIFTFKLEGEYIIRYYAEDYDGNYSIVEYKLVATASK